MTKQIPMILVHKNRNDRFPCILSADVEDINDVRRAAVIEEYCIPAFKYTPQEQTGWRLVYVLVIDYAPNGDAFQWYICRGLTENTHRDWPWITRVVASYGDKISEDEAKKLFAMMKFKINAYYRQ